MLWEVRIVIIHMGKGRITWRGSEEDFWGIGALFCMNITLQ